MPTVKKRTDNDGYLKLISKAPDMENSTDVLFTPKPMKKKASAAKKPTERKPRAAKASNPAAIDEVALAAEIAAEAPKATEERGEKIAAEAPKATELAPANEPAVADTTALSAIEPADETPADETPIVEALKAALGASQGNEKKRLADELSDIPTVAAEGVITSLHEEVERVMIKSADSSSYVNLGRDMPVHLL